MNKNKKRWVAIIVALVVATFAMVACEKVIEIDEADYEKHLVLNGLPSAGERFFVNFSHTHFFLDPNNAQPVAGAQLRLTTPNATLTPDSIAGCNYFFNYVCRPGDTLNMEVVADGETVRAQTYVPQMPSIDNIGVNRLATHSFRFYSTKFTLHDHGGNPEYYHLVVRVRDSGLRYDPWTQKIDTVDTIHSTYFYIPPINSAITSNDVNPFIPLGGYLYSQVMFMDKHIDGTDYPVELDILHLTDTNEINTEVDTFRHWYTVVVESITPARWNYLLSVARTQSISSYFAEQGAAWSNVSGALGIFSGMAKWTFSFCPDSLRPAPVFSPLPDVQIEGGGGGCIWQPLPSIEGDD